jgi:EAL and modified HD-GYP domain-containing signal transduction protein
MATQELETSSERPAAGPELFISRQPVVDGEMRVSGYRVAYSTADGDEVSEAPAARLLGDVLSGVGLEELVGESLAHLPLSRDVLIALGVPPVRPDRVMLRIAYDISLDPEVARTIEALTARGYALSLAAGLIDYTQFERAKALGFELFAGPFYASRHRAAVRKIPVGEMGTLVSLAAMQSGSASIEELEQVIDRDVGLSVKLLRYINSAYIGLRGSITSIRQAVMMLGSRGVSRWALLVALTGGPSAPRELSVVGLTRARMCELLGSGRGEVGGDGRRPARRTARDDRRGASAGRRRGRRPAPARRAGRLDPRRGGQLRAGRVRRRQPPVARPRDRHVVPRPRLGGRDSLRAELTSRSRTLPRQ